MKNLPKRIEAIRDVERALYNLMCAYAGNEPLRNEARAIREMFMNRRHAFELIVARSKKNP